MSGASCIIVSDNMTELDEEIKNLNIGEAEDTLDGLEQRRLVGDLRVLVGLLGIL